MENDLKSGASERVTIISEDARFKSKESDRSPTFCIPAR